MDSQLITLTQRGSKPSKALDIFKKPDHVVRVTFETGEFFARDPGGAPRFYQVRLDVVPEASCLESKSLKQFLWAMMEEWGVDQGAKAGGLVGDLLMAVSDALRPRYCSVTLIDRDSRERVQLDVGNPEYLPARLSSYESQSSRVISKCPITGQPDFYLVTVSLVSTTPEIFEPNGAFRGLSLPNYLDAAIMRATWGQDKRGMFAEALAGKIAQGIFAQVQPDLCRVELEQSPRGGIKLIAVAEVKAAHSH
jgi:NADPH-dependent 7-cyano-7-deazaguanine reductase QueF